MANFTDVDIPANGLEAQEETGAVQYFTRYGRHATEDIAKLDVAFIEA